MISRFYLVLYNVSQLLGWSYLFALSVPHWSAWANGQGRNDASKLYADTFKVLQIFQTLAVLEIIHAAIGLVKSNPVLTGFQVRPTSTSFWGTQIMKSFYYFRCFPVSS